MDFWRPLFMLCGRWVEDVCFMAFKHRPEKRIEGGFYTKAGFFFSLKFDGRYIVRNFGSVYRVSRRRKEEANVFP
jgi:hypothetical protein